MGHTAAPARTASGAGAFEVIAPDGTRTRVATLLAAIRESRRVRGTYKVVY